MFEKDCEVSYLEVQSGLISSPAHLICRRGSWSRIISLSSIICYHLQRVVIDVGSWFIHYPVNPLKAARLRLLVASALYFWILSTV
jgi:hypothetical protein